jgi:hypothetical protein
MREKKYMSLTREKALQIIRKHLIRQTPRDIEIQDGIPEDCTIYQRHFILLFLQSFQEVVRWRTIC